MTTTDILTKVIKDTTERIEAQAPTLTGGMTITQAIGFLERLQAIRDREAVYLRQKACKACIKKAQKNKN